MSRTTRAEVDAAARRAAAAARALGVDTTRWALHGGNGTAGVSFKLATGHDVVHLGTTKRDAYCALAAMARGLELVADSLRAAT